MEIGPVQTEESQMRAYELIDGNDVNALAIKERPAPQAGPGQVVIDVRACSLNYRDLLVVKGTSASSGRATGCSRAAI